MSATLGGLIKDLRLQKNISQLEIAFALGWKEPSRLSRIEQGKNTSPPRFLIENIMDAMKLSEEERNQLLVNGNYIPSKEEIMEARKKIDPLLKNWQYPATCIDYTWRLLYGNKEAYKVYDVPLKLQRFIESEFPHMLTIVFNPDFILNKSGEVEERKKFLLRVLTHFQYSQKNRTRERWYQELIKGLMNNKQFQELWPTAQRQRGIESDILNFSMKSLKTKTGEELQFYVFLTPVYADPRFILELHVPANKKTLEYFEDQNNTPK
jgi:transcriptional regulator with XRE-family HTH domain